MRQLTALLLAALLSFATFGIAWASASSVGTETSATAEAHAAHAAHAEAPAAFAVHHGHPDGVSTEDCAGAERGLRARHRDVVGHGTSPRRL
ncbi:MAG: hypothetical protein R6V44_16365, partial [Paracoccaceae bacterium]